jgi:hypothetical protein
VWLLAGCAGCAVLVVVASIILIGMGVSAVKSVVNDVGPVTAASIKQSLGEDLPVYPGSELQLAETQGVVTSFRVIEKLSGKPAGSIFGGAAMYVSSDSPEKVLKHYDAAMKKAGWTKFNTQQTGFNTQVQYKKGNEFGIVQVQKSPGTGGTMITLMRGGSELVEMNRRRQEQSGDLPTPVK